MRPFESGQIPTLEAIWIPLQMRRWKREAKLGLALGRPSISPRATISRARLTRWLSSTASFPRTPSQQFMAVEAPGCASRD